MGTLFISHSGADNATALKVRDWLRERGWGQVFLDLDPGQGMVAGLRWQQELKQAGERCSGVLLLLSPAWVASDWCRTEFLVAEQLGKRIFPLLIAPMEIKTLRSELRKFHIADVSTPEKEQDGFNSLALGLKRAGLDPKSFQWPPANEPQRPIYRGMQSLDEQDAAIFFGRDALITKALDALRRMRDGGPERMLVILGASGAGKSSFLKAGVIARLQRDEDNFLVLPVIRPALAALTGKMGLAASVSSHPSRLSNPSDLAEALERLRIAKVAHLSRFAANAGDGAIVQPPTIVIAIDQAEELFAAENAEAARMLDLLSGAVRADGNVIVVATIRSNAYAKLQAEPRLVDIAQQPFSLPPIPLGAFKEVIEGPARLADPPLAIDPALSDRLLQDLAAEDALPLLAFTLERLLTSHRDAKALTLDDYVEELGGLQGAVVGAVEAAFARAHRNPVLPASYTELEKLARAAFIPALVHLEDVDADPGRRVERIDALPEATRPLVRHLIEQRLLVCHSTTIDGVEIETVEVAHEAILRQWPALRSWIAEERDALRALDAIRAAAAEWRLLDEERRVSWLTHRGGRLLEAETLIVRPGFAAALGPAGLGYVAACRAREDAERLQERAGFERTKRLQRNIWAIIAVAGAAVVIAAILVNQFLAGIAARSSDILAVQAAAESAGGNYDRGARYALAGLTAGGGLPTGFHREKAEAELNGASASSSAIAVLRGHRDQVLAAVFSMDGKRIVTSSRDRTARIWDASSAREIMALQGHGQEVLNAAFSPDGARVVTASADGTARIWDVRTGRQLRILKHDNAVFTAAFSPDGRYVVTASGDRVARIWDAATGALFLSLRGHTDQVESAAFSPDGTRVVTASDDTTVRIWSAADGRQIAISRGHESMVESAAFSLDGTRIVTASDDGTARIWDSATGRPLHVFKAVDQKGINSANFSADGQWIVIACRDGTAQLWDIASQTQIAVLRGHDGSVNSGAFSPDATRIVTTSDDNTARLWDARPKVIVLRGHQAEVNSAVFSPDGKRLATASNDRTIRLWDARLASPVLRPLKGHSELIETIGFSRDGTRLVSASDDGSAIVWDAATGAQLAALKAPAGLALGAVFDPQGRRVATAFDDGTIRVWDVRTQRVLSTLRGHTRRVFTVEFSPDGKWIVSASADKTVRLWDASGGHAAAVLRGPNAAASSAMFSADGRRIVAAYRDKTAVVWDADTKRATAQFKGHDDAVLTAAFSPDGKAIVTASRDKTVRIWNSRTGRELAVLRGHEASVSAARYSPDGTHIVSASDDGTARIWDVSAVAAVAPTDLPSHVCQTTLAAQLSQFSRKEVLAVPVLDTELDTDACRPPSSLARLWRVLRSAF
ncbi:MAG: TIR domain-containing protein [Alphaproteobacteria bacterium]|nr:TIR domain-containing protein [Alphaproteobacteria bacterium]